jgi:hypothetical protein
MPSPTPEPVPTVVPWPDATDPVPAPESLPTEASVEEDGVRLSLSVAYNPIYAGGPATLTTRIDNTGAEAIEWINDGCNIHAGVRGLASGTWADSDVSIPTELLPYREWFLEDNDISPDIFLHAPTRRRHAGCADLGIRHALAPGDAVEQTFTWDGQAGSGFGLPPTGPATWAGTFAGWWRTDEEEGLTDRSVTVSLATQIIGGRRSDALSPFQVLDAALIDPRLGSWLLTRPLRTDNPLVLYDPASGLWTVGILMSRDIEDGENAENILHAAFVDPITGEVIAVRELPAQF